ELPVVLDPPSYRVAVGAPVLERLSERGLDEMLAHEGLQLLDEGVDGNRGLRALERVELEKVAGVGRGVLGDRLAERRGHAARYQYRANARKPPGTLTTSRRTAARRARRSRRNGPGARAARRSPRWRRARGRSRPAGPTASRA